ncbi:unnamed protein product [Trichobilharzia regenti]|nr:unnamed protein product [Trichobilharzia regenti]
MHRPNVRKQNEADYSNTNLSIFSFDLFQESPLELSFNLATTWPSVPSHAITEKPSWKSLKPEGAPEWQLQMCSTSPFVDRMSKLAFTVFYTYLPA